ncbi:MAG: NAD-dependent epimerase/dehydratase family protein, partial [Gemmatimonadales bacterium]
TKRALITGGAGFIGSHVADRFLAGGWTVEIIDNLSSGKRDNVPAGAKLHLLDVQSPDAARIVTEGRFDAVAHLAAQIDVRRSVSDPVFDAQVNILGSLNLLEAVRRAGADGGARFVFASTGGAIYGDLAAPPTTETTPKDPDSPYGIAKLAVEHYMAYYGRIHGVETASVRFSNVYGPRQDPHGEAGVVAIFCGRILDGRALTVFGDGRQTRDYVHVGDVAEAVFRATTIKLPPRGAVDARAFNIGTGIATSVVDLASTLMRAVNATAPIEFAPSRPGEQMQSFLRVERARDVLGWTPRVPLERGLAETYAYFAARARPAAAARS